jgi:hypothetical protein
MELVKFQSQRQTKKTEEVGSLVISFLKPGEKEPAPETHPDEIVRSRFPKRNGFGHQHFDTYPKRANE